MNKIHSIRNALGLTQVQFGKGINRTQGSVHFYESSAVEVPPDVAREIIKLAASHGLHLTFDEIYGE